MTAANVISAIAAYLVVVAAMKLAGELLLAVGQRSPQAGRGAGRGLEPRRRRRLLGDWVFVLGLVVCAVLGLIAVGAPLLAAGVPAYLLGTDEDGRDLLVRAIYAVQTSAVIAILAAIVATAIGMAVAFAVKRLPPMEDRRVLAVTGIRAFSAYPVVLAILAIVASTAGAEALTPFSLVLIIGAVSCPAIVTAARADASWRNIFATAVGVTAGALLLETTTSSFLVVVKPPTPSLGNMFVNVQNYVRFAPWIYIVPSIPLIAALFGLNAMGDGLRDAVDDDAGPDSVG